MTTLVKVGDAVRQVFSTTLNRPALRANFLLGLVFSAVLLSLRPLLGAVQPSNVDWLNLVEPVWLTALHAWPGALAGVVYLVSWFFISRRLGLSDAVHLGGVLVAGVGVLTLFLPAFALSLFSA